MCAPLARARVFIKRGFDRTRLLEVMAEKDGLTPGELLKLAIDTQLGQVDEFQNTHILISQVMPNLDAAGRASQFRASDELVERYRKIVEAGVASGEFVTEDPHLVAFQVVQMAHAWAMPRWHLSSRYDLQQYGRKVLSLALHQITKPGSNPPPASAHCVSGGAEE